MSAPSARWAIALLPLLVTGGPINAQTSDAELINHLRSNAPECGRFEQSRWLADFEMQLDSSGEFQRQADGLIWRTTQPVSSEVVLATSNPDLPLGYQAILPVFNGLLAGDWDALDEYFSSRISGSLTAWRAELTPRNEQVAAQLVSLIIEGADQLEQIALTFGDGDRMGIRLAATPCPSPIDTP